MRRRPLTGQRGQRSGDGFRAGEEGSGALPVLTPGVCLTERQERATGYGLQPLDEYGPEVMVEKMVFQFVRSVEPWRQ